MARVGNLVGGRKIYKTCLEVVKTNVNKVFTIIALRICIYKSTVVMSRTKRH